MSPIDDPRIRVSVTSASNNYSRSIRVTRVQVDSSSVIIDRIFGARKCSDVTAGYDCLFVVCSSRGVHRPGLQYQFI
jgi:hypothetical protein